MLPAVLAIVVAAVVALALAGADRLAARTVTRRVARRVQAAAAAREPAHVHIAGVPFVTQAVRGRYRHVDVALAAFGINGVEFSSLVATLSGVRAPLRALLAGDGLVVGQVSATVTIPLTVLRQRLPRGLTVAAHRGDLRISGTLMYLPVYGRLAVTAERHRLYFTPLGLGGFPALVGFGLVVPGLPDRLAIETVQVTAAGLVVRLSGADVHLG